MAKIMDAMIELLAEEHPMTVRQIFYRLVSTGVIAKTEQEYKGTVGRLLTTMRKNGVIPYTWLADATRWQRKPRSFDSLTEMLEISKETYRRALWTTAPDYVEIWSEKDAIASVLYDVTSVWDVPLMVARGYASLSFLHTTAEQMKEIAKPTYIYYFGDFDPSGVDARKYCRRTLREMAPEVELHFKTVAVTVKQIREWKLPTRPTKKTDTRSKKFFGPSVDVDAIPPSTLRELAETCIHAHVDEQELAGVLEAEDAERETLERFLGAFSEGENDA